MLSSNRVVRSGFMLVLACGSLAFSASAQNDIRSIQIESGWGGLGTPQHANVTILHENGRFIRDGRPIDAALVQSLVAALRAQPIVKPEATNLGITPAWLSEHLPEIEKSMPSKFPDALPSQKRFFETSFTDPVTIAKVVPDLFNYTSFDDNPYAKVELDFDDGSRLSATSNSYYAYMIPWTLNGNDKLNTFNAAISRAVSALLPAKSTGKERLAGVGFDSSLAEALMRQIEGQWNMLGVEARAGSTLATLQKFYTVTRADINPYHDVYFGKRWEANGPHETNLQVILHKRTFPANVQEHLVLQYEHGKVEGLDEFLRNGPKYEALALSVPWLNQYLQEHPQEMMTLMYVHHASFGDHAMQSFALDMKAGGLEDLLPAVRSQQSEIALLKIGYVYWLLFPDRHMMLWRFEGPSGFLKWKQRDFSVGSCDAYYAVNNGGCSGSEVTPDGILVPEGRPK